MILRTSSWVSVIQLPEIRHAPSDLAILRTRLSGQPRCWASAFGVVTSGSVIAKSGLSSSPFDSGGFRVVEGHLDDASDFPANGVVEFDLVVVG
jgi:hypothetical protein